MAEEVNGADGAADLSAQLETERQARILAEEQTKIAKVEAENWKQVGLRRKGKLEGDESFFGDNDVDDIEKVINGKVAQTQRELEIARQIESEKQARLKAEEKLAEVLRAKDNTPPAPTSGADGGDQKVPDGVFSEAQVANFTAVWTKRGYSEDMQKRMLETEKKNALARRNTV